MRQTLRLLLTLVMLALAGSAWTAWMAWAQEGTPESTPEIHPLLPVLTGEATAEATAEPLSRDELALFRVAHLDLSSDQAFNLYIDGAPSPVQAGDPQIRPGVIYGYRPSRPGTYSIAFTRHNQGQALIGPADVTFAPGHRYTLALVGSLADETLRLLFLDETQLLADASFDPATQSATLYVNNLRGLPSVDVLASGMGLSTPLPGEGGNAVITAPGGSPDSPLRITAGETVLIDTTRPGDPAGAYTLAALVGNWESAESRAGVNFGLLTPSEYLGAITLTEGGAITFTEPAEPAPETTPESTPAPDATAEDTPESTSEATADASPITILEFTDTFTLATAGERRRYTLSLDGEYTLDLLLQSGDTRAGLRPVDPYLRIYATDGTSVGENDTRNAAISATDAGGVLTLPAGDYLIDAASYLDLFGGEMILTVRTTQVTMSGE